MIPVQAKPEPAGFQQKVCNPGQKWLKDNGYPKSGAVPKGMSSELKPLWREVLQDLHDAYEGICAYSCTFIEPLHQAHSVDHFIPKSKAVELAYVWSNYRLASRGMNTKKLDHTDVLDPFDITNDTFYIEFGEGRIYANPELAPNIREDAERTITRLNLNSKQFRERRQGHYDDYRSGIPLEYLKRHSPFVWYEIVRQKL